MKLEFPETVLVRVVGPAVVLMYLSFGAYLPAISSDFFWDDDNIYIVTNHLLRASDGLYRIWFTTEPIDYYPLTYTSFWLEWQLWGLKPRPYHMLNILLHGGCGIILWRLLHRLGFAWAWIAAALFVLHPVNVESVAWITQRKGTLAAFFGFLCLLWYLRFQQEKQTRWLVLAVFSFALSLSAKPTLITLPIVFLAYEWWVSRSLNVGVARRLIPFFLLALLFGVIGIWFQEVRVLGGADVREQGVVARLLTAGWAFWFYVWKAIWPTDLAIIYPRWSIDTLNPAHYLPTISMLAVAIAAFKLPPRWRTAMIGVFGYYILTMLPVLGLVDVYYWRFSFVADHYQYQSIGALIALAVWIAMQVSSRIKRIEQPVKLAVAVGVMAVMFGLTYARAGLYVSSESLWKDTIEKNDDDFAARINLTHEYIRRDDWHAACQLALHPSVLRSKIGGALNAGWCLFKQGEFDAALQQFERAHDRKPLDASIKKTLEYVRRHVANTLAEQARTKGDAAPEPVQTR